ncbi:hypothetical protein ACSRUE_32475 [Sorangium sp. KYC3313]|uniref:hypothetical protein n=1 Tax=Sorangium sp. KYC3313 TaxID=3449740 RepID=UPI003F894A71
MPPTVTELALVVEDLISQRVTSNTFSRRGPFSGAGVTLKREGPLGRWVFRGELAVTHGDAGIHPVALADYKIQRVIKGTIQARAPSGGLRCGSVKDVVIERSIQKTPTRLIEVTVKLRLCPFVVCTSEDRRYLHVGDEEFEVSAEAASDLASPDEDVRLRALQQVVDGRWAMDDLLDAGGNSRQWNLDALLGAAIFGNTLYDRETGYYTMPALAEDA